MTTRFIESFFHRFHGNVFAVALACTTFVGCSRSDNTVIEAEAIQRSAQAVLAAADKSEASRQREDLRVAWSRVLESLRAFRGQFMVAAVSPADSQAAVGNFAFHQPAMPGDVVAALNNFLVVIEQTQTQRAQMDAAMKIGYIEALSAKAHALLAEVVTWDEMQPMAQFEAATTMLNRLDPQSTAWAQPAEETPTLTTSVRHR